MTRLEWITLGLYAGGLVMVGVAGILIASVGLFAGAVSWRALRDGLSSASRIEPRAASRPFGFNPARGEIA